MAGCPRVTDIELMMILTKWPWLHEITLNDSDGNVSPQTIYNVATSCSHLQVLETRNTVQDFSFCFQSISAAVPELLLLIE